MNLIEMIKEEFDGPTRTSISQEAGVSEEQVDQGLSAAIPSIMNGIMKNGETSLADGLTPTNNLFGSDNERVVTEISNATGLASDKSAGLLAMIIPTVTGLVNKLMTKHNWNFSDLIGRIGAGSSDPSAINTPDLPETDLPPATGFPKTDTPPSERPISEAPLTDIPEPEDAQPESRSVHEEQYSEENTHEVPPAPIPPVVNEPRIVEANETPVEETPIEEPRTMESKIAEPRADTNTPPPITEPTIEAKPSGGGSLRWVLIVLLIILLLWWLL